MALLEAKERFYDENPHYKPLVSSERDKEENL